MNEKNVWKIDDAGMTLERHTDVTYALRHDDDVIYLTETDAEKLAIALQDALLKTKEKRQKEIDKIKLVEWTQSKTKTEYKSKSST